MSFAAYEEGRRNREDRADPIAAAFHESYERQAHHYGYETRPESAVPWKDVPDNNKRLMRAVVNDLLDHEVVYHPRAYTRLKAEFDSLKALLRAFRKVLDD